jgi:tRNA threonylcarbamoyl adenosine modification protein YjeE
MRIDLPDETAVEQFAQDIAPYIQRGDMVRLLGSLGAGKSTFARALIKAMGSKSTHIPSPTYTLAQVYDDTRFPIAHVDAYRLEDDSELAQLGLEDYEKNGLLIVEWPREEWAAQHGLTVVLVFAEKGRQAQVSGTGHWQKDLEKII